MTEELNYISKKIEEIQIDIDYCTKELTVSEDIDDCQWYSMSIETLEAEKEYLNNILTFITSNCLQ